MMDGTKQNFFNSESEDFFWERSAPGQMTYSDSGLRLVEALDQLFVVLSKKLGCKAFLFSPFISVRELKRMDYFRSFPHLVSFPCHLNLDQENLNQFIKSDGDINFHSCEMAPIEEVLTPAACYHFYIHFQNQILNQPIFVTTKGTCFRLEKEYIPLRRQRNFMMREWVCMGSEAEVVSFLEKSRSLVDGLFQKWSVPIEWEMATDPFFNPRTNAKAIAQKIEPLKLEMVYKDLSGSLAVGSSNFHRSYFGETFNIQREKGILATTGCVAFGIDRWIYMLRSHFQGEISKGQGVKKIVSIVKQMTDEVSSEA